MAKLLNINLILTLNLNVLSKLIRVQHNLSQRNPCGVMNKKNGELCHRFYDRLKKRIIDL